MENPNDRVTIVTNVSAELRQRVANAARLADRSIAAEIRRLLAREYSAPQQ
jgi:hypothetical protein